MAKARWQRHRLANSLILEVLKSNPFLTTNKVKKALEKDYNFLLHHRTLRNYLEELAKQGHIEKITIPEEKNEVLLWKIK